jgi:hypothetical protein
MVARRLVTTTACENFLARFCVQSRRDGLSARGRESCFTATFTDLRHQIGQSGALARQVERFDRLIDQLIDLGGKSYTAANRSTLTV